VITIHVPTMTEREDARTISSRISDVPGVHTLEADLATRTVRVTGPADRAVITAAVAAVGYPVEPEPEPEPSRHGRPTGRDLTRLAVSATLHCLTGCAIGEILGMVIGTAMGWSNGPTVVLAIVLAFVFGYGFTIGPVLRSGLSLRQAIPIALAADTVSIAVMEIVDNSVVLLVPGAMDAGLTSGLFWGSLAAALVIAFVLTVPVNRWLIGRGKGHAVVHEFHGTHSS
jgi:cation transport ATPase